MTVKCNICTEVKERSPMDSCASHLPFSCHAPPYSIYQYSIVKPFSWHKRW